MSRSRERPPAQQIYSRPLSVPPPGNLAEALRWAREFIDGVDARVLLRHAAGLTPAQLAGGAERLLARAEQTRFCELVRRRAAGEPVAYLTGSREFYGREFAVSPAVLIPRPETELLVDLALARLPSDAPARVLDLGTGSGCIAVTLACERRGLDIYAVDASQAALLLARSNATSQMPKEPGPQPRFLLGDWYAPVAGERFDLIVANPPYVADGDAHLAQGDLRFEPRSALAGGPDGLAALRIIIGGAPEHLRPGGWLLVEHGYDQAQAVRSLFAAAGFSAIENHRDLAGIPRVTLGRIPG